MVTVFRYSVLLRADLDTFPTPRLLGNWPAGVLVDRGYYTNHGLESIKRALEELACSAGIHHHGWYCNALHTSVKICRR